MAILAGDIKKGVCLRLDDGKIYVVIDFLHVKPGKGNTVMRTKLRNVEDGRVLERTWIVSAKLDDVQVSHQQFQYLYKEGEEMVFMNTDTYEQVNISKDLITGGDFLKEGETMVMASIDESSGTILTAEAPVKVVLDLHRARLRWQHCHQRNQTCHTRNWCGDPRTSLHQRGRPD